MSNDYDFIIRDGLVVDGTGESARKGDVCVKDGRIAFVGRLRGNEGGRVLDADGCVVCPGFIDIHSHTDCFPLIDPLCRSKLADGVTTDVSGNCGSSPFPLHGKYLEKLREDMRPFGLEIDWSNIEGFFERMDSRGIGINLVMLVGHGAIRAAAMDYDNRSPTADEMSRMKHELKRCLEAGAWGMSTGLIYPPSCYAREDEIAELCEVVRDFDCLYATHMRNEGDEIESAVEEALSVAGSSGVRLQISHLKLAGKRNWKKIDWLLSTLRRARESSIDVAWDRYPYTASSTGLDVILPDWACEGGVDAEIERLKNPRIRRRISDEILAKSDEGRWDRIVISYAPSDENRRFEGKSIAAIAAERGEEPIECALNLIVEEKARAAVVIFSMSEENLERILKEPLTAIGSDASARSASGALARGKPHPRAFGTFSRVLGVYVREKGLLSLEEAVRRMTSLPASRLKLEDRGILRQGWWADIVVFDPERVRDNASFEEPHRYSSGIRYVLVNGTLAFEDGDFTGELAGRLLRR